MFKYLPILLVLLCGCEAIQRDATLYELEDARAYAACSILTLTSDAAPAPMPDNPTGECENCHGTGKVGDGRIEMECPVCNGTGKATARQNEALRLSKVEPEPAVTLAVDRPVQKVIERVLPKRETIAWLDQSEVRRAALESDKPCLFYWTADACVWCVRMERNVWSDPEVAAYVNEHFVAAKLNGSRVSASKRSEWGVRVYPTTYAITSDWGRKKELARTQDPKAFLATLKSVVASHAKYRERESAKVKAQPTGYTPAACDNPKCTCSDCECTNCACGEPVLERVNMNFPREVIEEPVIYYEPMHALRGDPYWVGGNWNPTWNMPRSYGTCGPGGCR